MRLSRREHLVSWSECMHYSPYFYLFAIASCTGLYSGIECSPLNHSSGSCGSSLIIYLSCSIGQSSLSGYFRAPCWFGVYCIRRGIGYGGGYCEFVRMCAKLLRKLDKWVDRLVYRVEVDKYAVRDRDVVDNNHICAVSRCLIVIWMVGCRLVVFLRESLDSCEYSSEWE